MIGRLCRYLYRLGSVNEYSVRSTDYRVMIDDDLDSYGDIGIRREWWRMADGMAGMTGS